MRILAIGAHPDDIEIACSGTLAKCAARGDKVFVCHVSNGDLGHVIIPPEELGEMRKGEAKAAGALAGIEVLWGGCHDVRIYADDKETRDKLVDVIRYAQPDLIITHNPDDYMPDHTAVSKLARALRGRDRLHRQEDRDARVPQEPARVDERARSYRFCRYGKDLLPLPRLSVRRGLRRGLHRLQGVPQGHDRETASLIFLKFIYNKVRFLP